MKWFTHILWNTAVAAALCNYFSVACTLYALAAGAVIHTVFTDAAGHSGLRRNKYHDVFSLAFAAALAIAAKNPVLLIFGPIHIALDRLSPGRLAVSWAYNVLWSLPAVFILSRFLW
jgi:hypothetical protein